MSQRIINVPRFRHGRRSTTGVREPTLVPRPYPALPPARMVDGLTIEAVSGLREIPPNTTPLHATIEIRSGVLVVTVPITIVFWGIDFSVLPSSFLTRYTNALTTALRRGWSRKHRLSPLSRPTTMLEVEVQPVVAHTVLIPATTAASLSNFNQPQYRDTNVVCAGVREAPRIGSNVNVSNLENFIGDRIERSCASIERSLITLDGTGGSGFANITSGDPTRDVTPQLRCITNPAMPSGVLQATQPEYYAYFVCDSSGISFPRLRATSTTTNRCSGAQFEQATIVHEFGHRWGLPDEYPLPNNDFFGDDNGTEGSRRRGGQIVSSDCRNEFILGELAARSEFTSSIMCNGSTILPQHYLPFAWMASLIQPGAWRVIRRMPGARQ